MAWGSPRERRRTDVMLVSMERGTVGATHGRSAIATAHFLLNSYRMVPNTHWQCANARHAGSMIFDFILENTGYPHNNRPHLHRQAALASTQRQTQGPISKQEESRAIVASSVCGIATPFWFDKSQHDGRTSSVASAIVQLLAIAAPPLTRIQSYSPTLSVVYTHCRVTAADSPAYIPRMPDSPYTNLAAATGLAPPAPGCIRTWTWSTKVGKGCRWTMHVVRVNTNNCHRGHVGEGYCRTLLEER